MKKSTTSPDDIEECETPLIYEDNPLLLCFFTISDEERTATKQDVEDFLKKYDYLTPDNVNDIMCGKDVINFKDFKNAARDQGSDPDDLEKGKLPDGTYEPELVYVQHFYPQ